MEFHPDIAPAMRNQQKKASETQNERNWVQHGLAGRYPEGAFEWMKRYSKVFRILFNDDAFYELVLKAHQENDAVRKNALLGMIQDALETKYQEDPSQVDEYGE